MNIKTRFNIFKRDNFTCQYCGRKSPEVILTLDHKYPKSKGGANTEDNLITACKECNHGKGDVLLDHIVQVRKKVTRKPKKSPRVTDIGFRRTRNIIGPSVFEYSSSDFKGFLI